MRNALIRTVWAPAVLQPIGEQAEIEVNAASSKCRTGLAGKDLELDGGVVRFDHVAALFADL